MELALHLADLSFSGGAPTLAADLASTARTAEAAGFTRLTVMDHLWQIRMIGEPEEAMLEAYTTLGFLAAHTETVLLHTLVTGVVYRAPGLLAKAVTTLDVLSGGRAGLGVGAAWNDEEATGLGLDFPSMSERFERLEEALQIVLQMWSGSEDAFDGAHYHLGRTLNSPQSLSRPHPKLMIGGTGERKTLRLVAKYADACNIFGGPETAHKLDVLREHCERESRDYDAIEKTATVHFDPSQPLTVLRDQLRAVHDVGISVGYLMVPGPEPRPIVEELGRTVIPEIAGW